MHTHHARTAATLVAIAGTTLIAAQQAHAGFILNGDINQTYDGFSDPWNIAGDLIVGVTTSGSLRVDNGSALTSVNGSIGDQTGSNGTVDIVGLGSSWSTALLNVGNSGVGTLNISTGASVTSTTSQIGNAAGSTGVVNVTGDGSQWNTGQLFVGRNGAGELNILGGVVNSTTAAFIGLGNTGSGEVTVSGMGSQWNHTGFLSIGDRTQGTLTIDGGGMVTTGTATLGDEFGGTGFVTVSGDESRWANNGNLTIGGEGRGSMTIQAGGSVTTQANAFIGSSTFSGESTVTVTGDDSQWLVNSFLDVGGSGDGRLTVADGGFVRSGTMRVGEDGGAGFVTVNGDESELVVGGLTLGDESSGTLRVENGGSMTSGGTSMGDRDRTRGDAVITGAESQWTINGALNIAREGQGSLTVSAGGSVTSGNIRLTTSDEGTASLTVTGAESELIGSGFLRVGERGAGTMTVSNGGTVNADTGVALGSVGGSNGVGTVAGAGSELRSAQGIVIADRGTASLNINSGAFVDGGIDSIGLGLGGNGQVNVNGPGTLWENTQLTVGSQGTGSLTIENQGTVQTVLGIVGDTETGNGTIAVRGAGSAWQTQDLFMGAAGNASLTIETGAQVKVTNAMGVGVSTTTGANTAAVHVTGDGSALNVNQGLSIGTQMAGELNIGAGSVVSVGTTTEIGDFGAVNLNGGRFDFGSMTSEDFGTINGVSGSLAGRIGLVEITGFNHISDINLGSSFANISENVDTSDVIGDYANSGVLFGDGATVSGLTNNAPGVVEVITSERMRFDGNGENNGRFDIFGGQLRFGGSLANNASIDIDDGQLIVGGSILNDLGGFIEGRGVIRAEGGLINRSEMSFSGGFTDFHGTITNDTSGLILTTGGGVTTFFDDVTHNGVEIRTAEGAFTVFLGVYSGAGSFTGDGLVQFEGLVNLGNSPAVVGFEGDVMLAASSFTTIEIGGELPGEFDAFEIGGDLELAGALGVELLDGFSLAFDQSFLIADVAGSTIGTFNGLSEGSLVSNFAGMELFISYTAGDGNDIALYTAVPTPGSAALFGCGLLMMSLRRRRDDD